VLNGDRSRELIPETSGSIMEGMMWLNCDEVMQI